MAKEKKIIFWIEFISVIAIIISSYLLYLHYSDKESFCDISTGLSCDIVNRSIYSEFPPGSGIPVSLMGIITFTIIIVLSELIYANKTAKRTKKLFSNIIFYLMIISIIFAAYLVYAELFLILSICILCVVLDIFIILILILSYKLRRILHEIK